MGQKVTAWLCDFLIPLAPAPSARVTNQGNSRQPEAPPRQANREKGTGQACPFFRLVVFLIPTTLTGFNFSFENAPLDVVTTRSRDTDHF